MVCRPVAALVRRGSGRADEAASMSRPVAVVAGASGFVGRALVRAFTEDGYDVRTIGRGGRRRVVDRCRRHP